MPPTQTWCSLYPCPSPSLLCRLPTIPSIPALPSSMLMSAVFRACQRSPPPIRCGAARGAGGSKGGGCEDVITSLCLNSVLALASVHISVQRHDGGRRRHQGNQRRSAEAVNLWRVLGGPRGCDVPRRDLDRARLRHDVQRGTVHLRNVQANEYHNGHGPVAAASRDSAALR